jgi:hypothetical protein
MQRRHVNQRGLQTMTHPTETAFQPLVQAFVQEFSKAPAQISCAGVQALVQAFSNAPAQRKCLFLLEFSGLCRLCRRFRLTRMSGRACASVQGGRASAQPCSRACARPHPLHNLKKGSGVNDLGLCRGSENSLHKRLHCLHACTTASTGVSA